MIAGLLRLVTVDEQGRPTRWRTPRDELPTPVATELGIFVERRLLTTDDAHGSAIIGVTHEAFLSTWAPLHKAVVASAAALRARRTIEDAATTWHDKNRPPGRLWTGGQLAAAVSDTGAHTRPGPALTSGPARWLPLRHRLLMTDRVDLSPVARDFLHASIRRDRSRRRRATTVLSTLLILALVGAGIAVIKQQDAQSQQRIATARQLTAQADAIRDSNPRAALQLGIAAQRIHPSDETKASLVSTLADTRYAGTLTAHTGLVNSGAFTADGHTLATTGSDGTVVLWDLTDRNHPRLGQRLTGYTNPKAVALTADGRTLAIGDADKVILWDLTDRNHPHQLGQLPIAHNGALADVALAADGQILATASGNSTVTLWDLTDRNQPPRQLGQPLTGAEYVAAFTADGHILATVGGDSTVTLWDLTDRNQPHRLGRPIPGADYGIALAADGHTLATTGGDGTVALWDLADRNHPRLDQPLTSLSGATDWVALTTDGRTLASGEFDGTVALWDLADRSHPRRLDGTPLTGRPVAFTADGHTLATTGGDGTVALWDLADRHAPRRLGPPLADAGHGMAFTADGHTLATTNYDDDTVALWDLTDGNAARRLGPPLDEGHGIAFTADGDTLATANNDGTVALWDLSDRHAPRRLGPPLADAGYPLAFTADGLTLASANFSGTVALWDLTDRNQPRRLGPPLTSRVGLNRAAVEVKGAFTANGHTLALATDDGAPYSSGDSTVVLWDLTDRHQPRRLGPPLTVRTSQLETMAVDGHTLATTGSDGTVVLWDLTDRNQPRRLGQPLAGGGKSVEFAPDGYTLATADAAGTVTLWDLSGLDDLRDHTVTRACSIIGRGLERDGWDRYVLGLPYQETCP